MEKLKKLKSILKEMDSVLIAFSGGVDSAFLLKVAAEALPRDKILAVTAVSATYPEQELLFSKKMAKQLGVKHKIITTGELKDKRFASNPLNRCYYCKNELFSRLKNLAAESGLNFVIDASNISDKSDFRPGALAKKKLGIRSPLQEAGISKSQIRILSKKTGLSAWNKPALACLASRIPYGTKITPRLLKRINKAECFLTANGFSQVRVRDYGKLVRIEVMKKELTRLIRIRDKIIDKFKKLGYNYITVDLEGYRTGSMNEVIE